MQSYNFVIQLRQGYDLCKQEIVKAYDRDQWWLEEGLYLNTLNKDKGKVFPLQARCGPEGG